ncbi:MAG: triose-phosphate isomerase [Bacteroidales bacterium]|nr:triose-phosphate isomerase [Bacteroidales bacterium]
MRKKIVAGNWKMNKTFTEADDLLFEIKEIISENPINGVELVVCPPAPFLELATDVAEEVDIHVGAQNVSSFSKGAYTGEISAEMLESIEVEYCIVGHSERRKFFGETNADVAKKVEQLLEFSITPIVCCGENLEEREAGNHFDVVRNHIEEGLFHLNEIEIQQVVIAYEPVWAIGTGKNATSEQAQEMHSYIRKLLLEKYGNEVAESISILYGGSCNAKNAFQLFANIDVDGGLIGGASLKAAEFIEIANSF